MSKLVTAISYVYLIGYKDKLKIGKSNNPEKRLKTLQTATPEQLSIKGLIACDTEKEAFELEKLLHNDYKSCKINNEWFDSSAIDIGYLLDCYKQRVYIYIPQAEITRALKELSQGAFRLLTYYYSRRDGWVFKDENIAETLNTSVRMVKRYRKELIDKKYLLIQKGEVDVYFIGQKAVERFLNPDLAELEDDDIMEPLIGGKNG